MIESHDDQHYCSVIYSLQYSDYIWNVASVSISSEF